MQHIKNTLRCIKRILRYINKVCLYILFIGVILSPVIMLLVDVYHEIPDRILNHITSGRIQDTYFDGSDWFSAIATLITAIPASIFGVIALQQTERLHKLEDRYHRPMLAVHSGTIEEIWLHNSNSKEECLKHSYSTRTYMKSIADGTLEGRSCLKEFVRFRFKIAVTNQIPVTNMYIKSLRFNLHGKEWKLELTGRQGGNYSRAIDSFGTDMLDGQYIVVVETVLHPFKVIEKPADAEEGEFTEELFRFMCHEQNRAYGYDRMGITAEMVIEYEFGDDGAQNLECRMTWKIDEDKMQNERRHGVVSRRSTTNGYFKYAG